MVNYFKNILIIRLIYKFKKWLQNKNQLKKFKIDFNTFINNGTGRNFVIDWKDCLPKLHDNSKYTSFDSHYIYHPAWAARVIKEIAPRRHVDFSSSLHFCTLISAFVPTVFYDYRPAFLNLSSLECKSGNLTNLALSDNSIECLSCLHTIEHIGLGRYGDELDPNGDLKAIVELQRVASDHILIVVPVGESRIYFNAHRVYDPKEFCDLFDKCKLIQFSFVDDFGEFVMPAKIEDVVNQKYACGCFYFRKR